MVIKLTQEDIKIGHHVNTPYLEIGLGERFGIPRDTEVKQLKQQILDDYEKARRWDETNEAVIDNFRINPMYSVKQKKMLWYVNTEKNYVEADARRLREKIIQTQKLRELIEKGNLPDITEEQFCGECWETIRKELLEESKK